MSGGRRRPGLVRPDPRMRRPRHPDEPARDPGHHAGDSLPGEFPYLSARRRRSSTAGGPSSSGAWRRPIPRRRRADAAGGPSRSASPGRGTRAIAIDRWRSFPLSLFAPLAELPGVRLISLQKGRGPNSSTDLAGRFPVAVLPGCGPGERGPPRLPRHGGRHEPRSTSSSPPTRPSPTWRGASGSGPGSPCPRVADWRWLIDRDDSPWYPTMTLFRQDSPGDWEAVFRRMADRLRAELAART